MGTIVSGATKVVSQHKMSSFFDESQMGGHASVEVEVPPEQQMAARFRSKPMKSAQFRPKG